MDNIDNYFILLIFIGGLLTALLFIEIAITIYVAIKEHKEHKRIMANVIRHDKFSRIK